MQPLGTSYVFGLGKPFLQQGFFIAPFFSGDEFKSDIPCNWVCFVPVDLAHCKCWSTVQAVIKAVQVVVSHQRNMCDVKGYVTAIYNGAWWVAV